MKRITRNRVFWTAAVVALGAFIAGGLMSGCDENGSNCGACNATCVGYGMPGGACNADGHCVCFEPDGGADADADVGDVPEEVVPDAGDDVSDVPGEEGTDPCPNYPCAPYGTELGNVVTDLGWDVANTAAEGLAGGDGRLDLHDLYLLNEDHGGTLKGLMIFVTAGWCPYCGEEADTLEAVYQALKDQGILLIGLVTDNNTPGSPANAAFGSSYATNHGWTFPTVIGDIAVNYWPPDSRAEPGVPLHVFIDLRNMRLYGRFAGQGQPKIVRQPLSELATTPLWGTGWTREYDSDCAPTVGTENEPNDSSSPENATTLPFSMTGTYCPIFVADGLFLDEEVVDLGTLTVGTVIEASVARTDGSSKAYPFIMFGRVSGTDLVATYGPSFVGGTTARRQWVVDTAGRYYLISYDGRAASSNYYGDLPIPVDDQCCEGGPDYTYTLNISAFTLATTDAEVTPGTPLAGTTFDDGDLNVHPMAVTSGTNYAIRLVAANNDMLDPYLILWNPDTSSLISSNDDEAYPSNINSLINYSATSDTTVWIVAGYWGAWYRLGAPAYTLNVTTP